MIDKQKKIIEEFKIILAEMESGNGEDYNIRNRIMLKNLYGVEIMPEAVDICKAMMLLRLLAHVKSAE